MTKNYLEKKLAVMVIFLALGIGDKLSDYHIENALEKDAHYFNSGYTVQKTFAFEYNPLGEALSDKEIKKLIKEK